jgi:hypothetical protein
VIWACSLETDLQNIPAGDLSIAGTSGITLSGGQKQRIVRDFNPSNPLGFGKNLTVKIVSRSRCLLASCGPGPRRCIQRSRHPICSGDFFSVTCGRWPFQKGRQDSYSCNP